MPATEPLCRFIGIDPRTLLKEENIMLEAELFYHLCEELKSHFKNEYKEYFNLIKFTLEMENLMLEENYIRFIINDILSTNEYTLEGIANHLNTHEDVIQEIVLGRNPNPSAWFLRKIIELHRIVRGDLYNTIMKKIAKKCIGAA